MLRIVLAAWVLVLTACGSGGEADHATAAAGTNTAPTSAPAVASFILAADAVRPDARRSALTTTEELERLGTLRERPAALDFGALPGRAAAAGTRLGMAFFDDTPLVVSLGRADPTFGGGTAYTGVIEGVPGSVVVLVDNGGVVSAWASSPDGHYALQGSAEHGYVARQVRPRALPLHPGPPRRIDLPTSAERPDARALAAGAIPRDDGSLIDVMVLYSPSARNRANGTAQMLADIDAQIALTNAIYANSNVVQRLRLVYSGEIAHTEQGMTDDLQALPNTTDGVLDEAARLRDLFQADVVSFWGDYGLSGGNSLICGYGWIMSSEGAGFAPFAYNVVNSPCNEGGGYVFAHELGHNMGLEHDILVSPGNTSVTPEAGGALTPIGYAHGYVDVTNRFRTVMAYNEACVRNGFNCYTIPHFSNPAISFDNRGNHPPAVPATTGDAATANERQALNDTRDTVANFRASQASPAGIVGFAPASYQASESATTVQLTVVRARGSTGAVSVAYRTVDGSALAGSDYTAASGTLSWAAGDASPRTITVALRSDPGFEPTEAFSVVLDSPTGGVAIGAPGSSSTQARVELLDHYDDQFPSACTLPAGWVVPAGASTGWGAATDQTRGGSCSLRSNALAVPTDPTQPTRAQIQFTGNFVAGEVSFFRRVSSIGAYDCFRFLVDGVQQAVGGNCSFQGSAGASGELPWQPVRVPISAGVRTLTWSFERAWPFATTVASAAWIDGLVLPTALPSAPFVTNISPAIYRGTALVGFLAPTHAGSSAVAAYTAVCSAPGQPSRSGTGSGSPVAVAGLADGVAYTCTVAASNGAGSGPASAASGALSAPPTERSADFNGDGRRDLVWQNTGTGERVIWFLNGSNYVGGVGLGTIPVAWDIAASGDFNNDGKADLLWQNTSTGERTVWLMDGSSLIGGLGLGTVPVAWQIAAVGDFNGDGKSDIVWQNTATGDRALWFLDGVRYLGGVGLGNVPPVWQIAGAGDFNGDGRTDLLWQNTSTGDRAVWFLSNGSLVGSATLATVPVAWQIAGTGDFNGDGKTDLVWQNTSTGERVLWYLDGTALVGGAGLTVVGTGWRIAR